jgi:hypothetical protein
MEVLLGSPPQSDIGLAPGSSVVSALMIGLDGRLAQACSCKDNGRIGASVSTHR